MVKKEMIQSHSLDFIFRVPPLSRVGLPSLPPCRSLAFNYIVSFGVQTPARRLVRLNCEGIYPTLSPI